MHPGAQRDTQGSGVVAGRLVDAADDPVVTGEVRLETHLDAVDRVVLDLPLEGLSRPAALSRATGVGAAGEFRFAGLPPGTYRLSGRAVGYDLVDAGPISLAQGESRQVTLRLGEGRTLSGRVADDRGAPLAGARVHLWRGSARPSVGELADRRPQACTGSGGEFRIAGVRPERGLRLAVECEGFVTESRAVDFDRACSLRLARACRVGGRVTRSDGSPVSGARVVLAPLGEPDAPAGVPRAGDRGVPGTELAFVTEVCTAEDGSFALGGLPARAFRPSVRSWAGSWSGSPIVTGLEPVELDVVLAAPASLCLRVVDPGGGPVAGARLLALPAAERGESGARSEVARRADARGRATFFGLSSELWQVTASAPGRAPAEVLATPGTPTAELELVLFPSGSVSVEVVDARGVPVPAARVELRRSDHVTFAAPATSDGAGRALWSDLAPGPYVVVHDPGWIRRALGEPALAAAHPASVTLDLRAGEARDVLLELTRESLLAVSVERAGAPVEGATVMLVERAAFLELAFRAETRLGSVRTDARGVASLPPVLSGSYSLCVRASRSAALRTFDIDLAPGRQATHVALDSSAVAGVVLGEGGEPLARARVRLVPLALAGLGTGRFAYESEWSDEPIVWAPGEVLVQTGPSGAFRFEDVEAGPYELEVEAAGHAPWTSGELELDGSATELDPVRLSSACAVRGAILGLDPAQPVAAAFVSLRTEDGQHVSACVLDAEGAFEFYDVPLGRYRLAAAVGGSEVLGDPFDVDLETVTVQDLALP